MQDHEESISLETSVIPLLAVQGILASQHFVYTQIVYLIIMSLYDLHLGKAPKLQELLLLKYANGKELRIMEAVAPFWKKVASTLGFDEARIRAIEVGCHYQSEDATREMFCLWLEGDRHLKPATWSTLVQSLKDVNLTEIAVLLSNLVCLQLVKFTELQD